jgi:hypothetical protein
MTTHRVLHAADSLLRSPVICAEQGVSISAQEGSMPP